MTAAARLGDPAPVSCFHCQAPVPAAVLDRHASELLGKRQAFCCHACRCVAESIAQAGLTQYYEHRDQPPSPPLLPSLHADDHADTLDAAGALDGFVSEAGNAARITLALEGVHCAACGWLIEHCLRGLPGVEAAEVKVSSRRLSLVWRPQTLPLSRVFRQLQRIGYHARPWRADEAAITQAVEARAALKRLGVAGILWFQVMMATMATWPEFNLGLSPQLHTILRWVGLFLTTPIVFYSCAPFFHGACRALRARQASMDLSVALAIGGAYCGGIYTAVTGKGELYFDTVGMFAFFLLAGRYLEHRVRARAAQAAVSWEQQLPPSCLRLGHEGISERVLTSALRVGDEILVPPGATVAADGVILLGHSRLDEALLTGEFKPCARGPGDCVNAGTVNLDQRLRVRVTAVGDHSQLSTVGRLLERAQAQKPALVRLADNAARWFMLASLCAAALFGGLWCWLDPAQAPWVVLAMLVATCPCALSLATPTALTAALSALQRQGVLITRGHVLETLNRVDTLLLDKTGTLTEGRPRLVSIQPLGAWSQRDCLQLASALQQDSGHLLAHAFPPAWVLAEAVQAVSGLGLEGLVEGRRLRLGAARWASALSRSTEPPLPDSERQWLLLADTEGPLAWFGLDDHLRDDALALLKFARDRGWRVLVASGDSSGTVASLSEALHIEAYGGLLPAQKLQLLERLHSEGRIVLALGDGSNDAPLLAQADVGIAMGQGTDLARTKADAVLLTNRLAAVVSTLRTARRCRRVIVQNLAWASVYNGLVLPFAAMALVTPAWAAVGMSLSSLLVTLNALRLSTPMSHTE